MTSNRWKTLLVICHFILLFSLPLYSQQTALVDQEPVTPAPVILEGETVFYIRAGLKNLTPEARADNVVQRLTELSADYAVPVERLRVVDTDISTDIVADQHIVAMFVDADAAAEGKSRVSLARETLPKIKNAVLQYRHAHSKEQMLKGIGETALATLALVLAMWLVIRISRRLTLLAESRLRLPGADASKLRAFSTKVIGTIRAFVIAVLVYVYLQSSFAFFPGTRALSRQLFSYVLTPLQTIASAFLNKIPDLLFLCVLAVVTHYFLKFLRLFFYLIETSRWTISGFYPEWARPTYRIVRVLVIGFALVVAFPYVPGSNTEAFKGISIFAGVLISLGSTSAISNVIAGVILAYMRPYKIGDWVMIGDTMGVVIETSFLVTRIHTPKNEEITVANANVLGKEITNYSNMARQNGLIVHTSVTIGYGAPWARVHELLISAARATEQIRSEPLPFVLQTALNDFYVTYQINAYTDIPAHSKNPQDLQLLYSALHRNIQDKFNEGGVEIMSPHYIQLRDGNEPAVPGQYVPKDHIPGALRVLVETLNKKS